MAQRETVDTAVIVRAYEEADGCPHCRFEREADAYSVDRLLDGNMMVESIRMETDARGFCHEHMSKLINSRSRFSVAVMIESHLKEIQDVYLKEASAKTGKGSLGAKTDALNHDCYLCRQREENMGNFEAGVAQLWKKREDFRELFASKGNLCMNHFARQLLACEHELDSKTYKAMSQALFDNTRRVLDKLQEEAKFYASRFDYRVTGAAKNFGASADVLERVCEFLTKDKPFPNK